MNEKTLKEILTWAKSWGATSSRVAQYDLEYQIMPGNNNIHPRSIAQQVHCLIPN